MNYPPFYHTPLTQVTKNAGPQELVEMEGGVDRKQFYVLDLDLLVINHDHILWVTKSL